MKDVFDQIATSWYNFRHRSIFTTELEELSQRWQRGRLLNIGCGHGPDFVPFREGFELHGIDISPRMLELASKYAAKFKFTAQLVEANATSLPYANEFFDYAIAIASYHHIEDPASRTRAFSELYRVLRPGGEAFITVWNRWQPKFWFKPRNVMVPWKSGSRILHRYYYLFSFRELENMVQKAGFTLLNSSPERRYKGRFKNMARNVCVLVKKPD